VLLSAQVNRRAIAQFSGVGRPSSGRTAPPGTVLIALTTFYLPRANWAQQSRHATRPAMGLRLETVVELLFIKFEIDIENLGGYRYEF
jgi:hypothetical protein